VLLFLVLLLAFFSAFFPVTNSDLWYHLAAGRGLVDGSSKVMPSTWVFDAAAYAGSQQLGVDGLVLAKAWTAALAAFALMQIRRPGSGLTIPALVTALAMMAVSPWFTLQPACVSLFFLVVTLRLLHGGTAATPGRLIFPLLLLVLLLWANVDSWFWLGPVLVGLFWLGGDLGGQRRTLPDQSAIRDPQADSARIPAWLVPAAFAVTLLNPHHVLAWEQAFTVQQVAPLTLESELRVDISVVSLLLVVLLSLVSFRLNRFRFDWRATVWGGFVVLVIMRRDVLPFFVLVAAPIAALNLQDFFLARSMSARRATVARVATGIGIAALIVLAWPGGLQGFRKKSVPDPSLRRIAERLEDWRIAGLLTENDRGFATRPDIAHYCAWYCPGAMPSLEWDGPDSARIQSALTPSGRMFTIESSQTVLQRMHINFVMVDDGETFSRLARDPENWDLLCVEGRAAIFGWTRAGGCSRPLEVPALDGNRLARSDTFTAPARGPEREPTSAGVWNRFRKPASAPSLNSESAGTYLRYFRINILPRHQARSSRAWAAHAAGIVGTAGVLPALPPANAVDPMLRLRDPALFLGDPNSELADFPVVAVRLARQAVVEHPDDGTAYLRLGQGYVALHELAEKPTGAAPFPLLAEMRQIQIATALHHAVLADPDRAGAHELLANLFQQRGYLDAALHHAREKLRLLGRKERRDLWTTRVNELEKVVQNRRTAWTIATRQRATVDPGADAADALRHGLALAAFEECLLPAPQDLLDAAAVRLELTLALQLGRGEQIRALLSSSDTRENKGKLGFVDFPGSPSAGVTYRLPAYDWLAILHAGATGDYERAEARLQELIGDLRAQHTKGLHSAEGHLPRIVATEVGLTAGPLPSSLPRLEREALVQFLAVSRQLEVQLADLDVLAGMLAWEQGNFHASQEHFRAALQVDQPFPGRVLATRQW
jgi:hypothetical protein